MSAIDGSATQEAKIVMTFMWRGGVAATLDMALNNPVGSWYGKHRLQYIGNDTKVGPNSATVSALIAHCRSIPTFKNAVSFSQMSPIYSVIRGARRIIRRCSTALLCGRGSKVTCGGSDECSSDLQTMTATILQELRPTRSDHRPSLGQDRLQSESHAVRRLRLSDQRPKHVKGEDYDRVLYMDCSSNLFSRYKDFLAKCRAQLATYLGRR